MSKVKKVAFIENCPACLDKLSFEIEIEPQTRIVSVECRECGAIPQFHVKTRVEYALDGVAGDARWGGLEAFRKSLPEGYRYELFRFFASRWSVVKARYLVAFNGRWPGAEANSHEIYDLPFDGDEGATVPALAKSVGVDKLQQKKEDGSWSLMALARVVDHEWAMSDKCSLDEPIILGLHRYEEENPSAILLDGGHRLYKAFHTQQPIKAYLLTEDETRWIRM